MPSSNEVQAKHLSSNSRIPFTLINSNVERTSKHRFIVQTIFFSFSFFFFFFFFDGTFDDTWKRSGIIRTELSASTFLKIESLSIIKSSYDEKKKKKRNRHLGGLLKRIFNRQKESRDR